MQPTTTAPMQPYQLIRDPPASTSSTSTSTSPPSGSAREKSLLSYEASSRHPQATGDHVMSNGYTTTTKKRKRAEPSMRFPTILQPQKKVKQPSGDDIRSYKDSPSNASTASSSTPWESPNNGNLEDIENQTYHLANALRNACDEIRALKADLVQSSSKAVNDERVVRQQMLFDFMLKQDQIRKECERTSARHIRVAAAMRSEIEKKVHVVEELKRVVEIERRQDREAREKLHQQCTAERNKYLNALSTSNLYQTSLEHCQQLLKTAEEDLAELQRIHNEEKILKQKATRGLPPAYGSLDDVEAMPPWGRHEDGGSLDMAQIKHTIRERFTRDLHNAQALANTYRESQDRFLKVSAGVELFRLCSLALQEACVSLREVLDNADDVDISPRSKKRQKRRQGRSSDGQRQEPISRRVYIADRVAKLVLDLNWRLIAVFDLRPQDIRVTLESKTEIGLYWRTVDDVFLEAVKATFHAISQDEGSDENNEPSRPSAEMCPRCKSNECPGHCVRVTELQYFLTLLKNVSKKLDHITTNSELRGTYFVESYEWLTESVETERRLAANSTIPRFPSPCPHVSHLAGHGTGGSLADAALMARLNEGPPPDDDTATVPDENIEALAEQAAQLEQERYVRRAEARVATQHELDIIQRAHDRAFANDPVLQEFFSGPSGRRALAPEDEPRWREVGRDESGGTRTLRRTDGGHSELRLERVPPSQPMAPVGRHVLQREDSVDSGAYERMREIRAARAEEHRAILAARYATGGDVYGRG
ncbi:hypothetical protein CLAFUW4_13581 [Fulvia fulva]|nr:hypothetical protein CLAFUR4_13584 [Fulvia fulva]KAK4611137.1 hypothetical protein CLAFUR0_13591 [Fulvia fulva]WPV22098.1 hypothetical protein CLAFUW4_13581 [Fulvia fulva]WPV36720.1 hypothetical protein CLAFUW7_13589 [Fulvia fulva]